MVSEDDPLSRLARTAVDEIRPGMRLGLGTGSTAEAVIRELGRRVARGLSVVGVATSRRSAQLAGDLGIPLTTLDEVGRLDLGIDGADEIDPRLDCVKGQGGALLHEKLVALACDDYLLVAAAEKMVPQLGTRSPLAIEIVPFGWRHTSDRLASLGLVPQRREVGDGSSRPYISDSGGFILDCAPSPIVDPATLAARIKGITGVVDHGLFLEIARRAFIADGAGSVRVFSRS